ncbi:MAG: ABC transporter permease subunit [Candidatus Hodarchaeota archaeon]
MNIKIFYYQLKNDLWDDRFKFVLLLFLFTFQVITSIITIFYMEDLLALFGLNFLNPIPPTGELAFKDFFGDQIFFGLLIMALGSMSIFAGEIENGSIHFSLTRPISRTEYALARILARLIALLFPFVLAVLIGWIYLGIVFETFPFEKLFWSSLLLVLFFTYLGIVTSALSSGTSTLTAGIGAITVFIVQFSISAFEPIEMLSPFTLVNIWTVIITNQSFQFTQELFINIGLLIGWIIFPLLIGIHTLRTRDL